MEKGVLDFIFEKNLMLFLSIFGHGSDFEAIVRGGRSCHQLQNVFCELSVGNVDWVLRFEIARNVFDFSIFEKREILVVFQYQL